MSGELSTHTIIPDDKSDLQEEHATLVEKEIKFLRENLSDLRIDSDNGYGFFGGNRGTKGRVYRTIYSIKFQVLCAIKTGQRRGLMFVIWNALEN